MDIYRAPADAQFINDPIGHCSIHLYPPFFQKVHYLDIQVTPEICAVSEQMVIPFYNMTDRLDSPVAPSGSGGLGAAICRVPFPS